MNALTAEADKAMYDEKLLARREPIGSTNAS
jgi:hypothetical protein